MTDQLPHIVTDSTADIPPDISQRLDITVIPCQIQCAGQTYLDGIDITRQELFRRMRAGDTLTTSQPPIGDFSQTYRRLLEGGRRVIAIHLGSPYSGLYGAAQVAAAEVDPERITVIDSQQVSMCVGWLAIHAAEAAKQGRGAEEIIVEVQAMVRRLRLYALIDDLRFLHRGGRVSWLGSMVGGLFSVKPIICIQAGEVLLAEKVRSLKRGIERMAALSQSLGHLERLAILHADALECATELAEQVARFFPRERLLVTEVGSIVSAHAGPGAVGLACLIAG